jgi:hypothetical protein
VTDHSRAAADVAFGKRSAASAVQGSEHVLCLHVKAVCVAQVAVPRLRDDRQRPPITARIGLALLDAPGDDGIAHSADAVGAGDRHRTFEKARLLDPVRARHLAVAVEAEDACEHRFVESCATARQDHGNAGAHGMIACSFDESRVADGDGCDVSDRVERAWRAVEGDAECAGARMVR